MTVANHICVSVACGVKGCEKAFGSYADEGVMHFDGIDEAREDAAECDWFVGADGIALCGDDDEGHLAQGRTRIGTWTLSADEIEDLRRVYPQFTPENGPAGKVDGQLALARTAGEK